MCVGKAQTRTKGKLTWPGDFNCDSSAKEEKSKEVRKVHLGRTPNNDSASQIKAGKGGQRGHDAV